GDGPHVETLVVGVDGGDQLGLRVADHRRADRPSHPSRGTEDPDPDRHAPDLCRICPAGPDAFDSDRSTSRLVDGPTTATVRSPRATLATSRANRSSSPLARPRIPTARWVCSPRSLRTSIGRGDALGAVRVGAAPPSMPARRRVTPSTTSSWVTAPATETTRL